MTTTSYSTEHYPTAPTTVTTTTESEWVTGGEGAKTTGDGKTQVAIPTLVRVNDA